MAEPSNLIVFLRKAPFVRMVIPLLLGIICAEYHFISLPFNPFWPCCVLVAVCLLLLIVPLGNRYSLRWLWGVLFFLAIFFAGQSLIGQQKKVSELPMGREILLRGTVVENPVQKPKSKRLIVQASAFKLYGSWFSCNEKLVLYLMQPLGTDSVKAGQLLVVKATLQPIKPPANPEEFDYQTYMRRKGFFATAFVRSGSYEVLTNQGLSNIRLTPLLLQQKLVRSFEKAGIQGRELAVLMGLTIGDKQLLDEDLMEAYATAGVIHVLSVSGLHVGLLLVILSFALSFLDKKKGGRVARILLTLVLLWFYAALVGFVPSVTRATLMFSMVLLAQLSGRKGITANSLAASAFFICLFSPYSVFSIGFQLSYMAVLGIAVFYPYFRQLLDVKNKLLRGVWQLCCVSMAAQLATLPLTVFYFHQMPIYFLLANVMVIPLVSVITYLIVLFVLVSWVPVVSTAVAYSLNECLRLLNYVVTAVQQLPFSLWNGIYVSPFQEVLLLVVLALLAMLVNTGKKLTGYLALGLFILVISLGIAHRMQTGKQQLMAVCSVSNATFIAFVDGHHAGSLRDSASMQKNVDYNLGGYFAKLGIRLADVTVVGCDMPQLTDSAGIVQSYKGFLLFGGKIIKVLSAPEDVATVDTPMPISYLIVTDRFKTQPRLALACYAPQLVILDSSVKQKKQKAWMTELDSRGIPYHNVNESGAFICNKR